MEKKVPSAANSSKKLINQPAVTLSQSEIELKSLKGKSPEPVKSKLSSIDATPASTTIKREIRNHCRGIFCRINS